MQGTQGSEPTGRDNGSDIPGDIGGHWHGEIGGLIGPDSGEDIGPDMGADIGPDIGSPQGRHEPVGEVVVGPGPVGGGYTVV
jgi:hypothetical protein